MKRKADYGFDAPITVATFMILGSALVGVGILLVEGVFILPFSFLDPASFVGMGLGFMIPGSWMIVGSRFLKFRTRDRLLQKLDLRGTERTLDVGCGRGLLLNGTAKKLTTGKAFGVDIWQTEDQSGNDPTVTLENAEREGVAGKVHIVTGDARKLPFEKNTFDAVTSSWAIHNIRNRKERESALSEMIRVLKPEGKIALLDIKFGPQYDLYFKGRSDVTFEKSGVDLTFLTPGYLFLVTKK